MLQSILCTFGWVTYGRNNFKALSTLFCLPSIYDWSNKGWQVHTHVLKLNEKHNFLYEQCDQMVNWLVQYLAIDTEEK